MMYRAGWGTKDPGQKRILAIDITREGFEWALRESCLSHFDVTRHGTHEAWRVQMAASPVRIQWDPERDLEHRPLLYRSLQVGLQGDAVRRYVGDWIAAITEVTQLASEIHALVRAGDHAMARARLPVEREYALSDAEAARVMLGREV